MVRSTFALVTNLLLLILLSTPAFAGIGSITDFRGAGNIKRAAKVMPAARGSGVEKNDTVTTNSQGRFRITFVDSTTVNITENSRLVIDDFVFNGGGSKGKLGLKIALGTVRYASGAIAHKNPGGVNIRTPTATIGVRGTDFVMSVDEVGKTTVVLLPSCFDDKDPTKNTDNCPVGAIDVITAAGVVKMTQPFQATMVENSFTPPSPPIKVNLSLRQINNSLQVSSPQTSSGLSLAKVSSDSQKQSLNPAKAASDSNKNPSTAPSQQQASSDSTQSSDTGSETDSFEAATEIISIAIDAILSEPETVIQVQTYIEEVEPTVIPQQIHTNVSPVYDTKATQTGWAYSVISQDKQQAATIILPLNSQVQVTVIQNGMADSYNFANQNYPSSGTGNAQGQITITQQGVVPK